MARREEEIGHIDHYYPEAKVAGIHVLTGRLCVGDRIHIKGHTSDFEEEIRTMEVNHCSVREVGYGAHVGVPVHEKVRVHDRVFVVHP